MVKKFDVYHMRFDGGRLCLDFVNTIHDRFVQPLDDYLKDINDLIVWAYRAGLVDEGMREKQDAFVNQNSVEANAFFNHAITIRELLYRLFLSVAKDKKIADKNLKEFNGLLSDYFSKLYLTQVDLLIEETWDLPSYSLYLITAPVVKDTYNLLMLNNSKRIKECSNCGWLFYDGSKNGKRRWCSMETCGSQVKAKDWYHRQKNK